MFHFVYGFVFLSNRSFINVILKCLAISLNSIGNGYRSNLIKMSKTVANQRTFQVYVSVFIWFDFVGFLLFCFN